jgi:cobalt-zinc-cadmium efflux system membrane fusion protein
MIKQSKLESASSNESSLSSHTPAVYTDVSSGGWLWNLIPNIVVLAAIVGVAWFGHHTEWTFGVLSRRDVSREHSTESVATLITRSTTASRELCKDHEVFDCPLCHPDRAQLDQPPQITSEETSRVKAALDLRPRGSVDPSCAELPREVQFPSADAAEKAGIDIAPVWRESVTESIVANGELEFDPARLVRLSARVTSSAWRVYKQTGSEVRAGEILALVDSVEVGRLKAELQHAIVQVRLKTSAHQNIADSPVADRLKREAKAELREAENRLMSAEQALVNFGFSLKSRDLLRLAPEELSRQLQLLGVPQSVIDEPADSVPGSLLPIRAPFDGVVLESNVIAGEVVKADQTLFTIVDPRELWLSLSINLADAGLVRIGQAVQFRPDGSSDTASGAIGWIGSTADEHTRAIPVRVTLPNPDGTLRAYSLGEGRIVLRGDPQAIVVPAESVQTFRGTSFVFVRHKDFLKPNGPKSFHLRAVRLGAKSEDSVEVIAGVYPGEVVATKGSALLLNEITRDPSNRIALTRQAHSVAKRSATDHPELETK